MSCHTLLDFCRNKTLHAVTLLAMIAFSLVSLVPSSHAQLDNESIIISTTKSSYSPGDIVNLSGSVIDGSPGQLVAMQVKDPNGNLILIRTVQVDQNGNFVLQFKIPLTASPGSLDIDASARINGFVITQSKAITSTVPEFPTSGLVFALGIASLILFRVLSSQGFAIKKVGAF